MGVCGYTYDQVNEMPMHALANAIAARTKMINGMIMSVLRFFGAEEAPETTKTAIVEDPNAAGLTAFDALFGGRKPKRGRIR